MSDIVLREDAPVIPAAAAGLVQWAQSAKAAYSLAQSLVSTSFSPAQYRGKPEEAAAAILAGSELGLSPMASLRAFDVISGQAAPRAITYRAVLQSMGHEIVITEQTPTKAAGKAKRRGSSEWQTAEFTIQQATQLGLTSKDNWKKQPGAMLVARVTTLLARLVAADAILGIPYSAEELADGEETTVTVTRSDARPRTTVQRKRPEPVAIPEPELDDPVPADEPETDEELITDAQLKKLHASLRDNDLSDRAEGLAWISGVLNRQVTTTKDLTKVEASQVIDALVEGDDQ